MPSTITAVKPNRLRRNPRVTDACNEQKEFTIGQPAPILNGMDTGFSQVPALRAELAPGERVLWEGRPDAHRWLFVQDWYLVPFSLMWGGFSIFWEASALSSPSSRSTVIFPLWGVPFVLIGLYLMVGRFFARHRIRKATSYAVTDQRVIEIGRSLFGGQRVNSVWLASYPPVEKRVGNDGRGTVWIGQFPVGRSFALDPSWPGWSRVTANGVVLADIPDAARVAALVASRLSRSAR